MKYLLSICLVWLNVILISCIIMAGCAAQLKATPQPEPHPIAGTSLMFIPEGCKIGDIVAPEDGVYIGESRLIEAMKQQQREKEKRERQKRT